MCAIVVGGAGFLGSTLVDQLVNRRQRVIVVDDLSTGKLSNLEGAISSALATFVYADITREVAPAVRAIERLTAYGDRQLYGLMDPVGAALHFAEVLGATFVTVTHGSAAPWDFRKPRVPAQAVSTADAYGPRMSQRSSRTLQVLFAALLAGEPLPVRGIEQRQLRLSYSEDVAELLIDSANSRARQLSDDVVRSAEETVVTIGEVCDLLDHIAKRRASRCRSLASDALFPMPEDGTAAIPATSSHERLERSLRRTYHWYFSGGPLLTSLSGGSG